MLSETFLALNQPNPELIELLIKPTEIVFELQSSRNQLLLAQATNPETRQRRTQTIEIPEGYILCPKDYVCIPKDQYTGQPVAPSTVNQAPQATITNPNPNQLPSQPPQHINQINQNLNPNIGQINNQPNQISSPGSIYPNQGINSPIGQPGGIGINQQNIGGFNNGANERGRIFTDVNFGINMRVSF
jgi:hypothetical protein